MKGVKTLCDLVEVIPDMVELLAQLDHFSHEIICRLIPVGGNNWLFEEAIPHIIAQFPACTFLPFLGNLQVFISG